MKGPKRRPEPDFYSAPGQVALVQRLCRKHGAKQNRDNTLVDPKAKRVQEELTRIYRDHMFNGMPDYMHEYLNASPKPAQDLVSRLAQERFNNQSPESLSEARKEAIKHARELSTRHGRLNKAMDEMLSSADNTAAHFPDRRTKRFQNKISTYNDILRKAQVGLQIFPDFLLEDLQAME